MNFVFKVQGHRVDSPAVGERAVERRQGAT
jgi:hypothetical protein